MESWTIVRDLSQFRRHGFGISKTEYCVALQCHCAGKPSYIEKYTNSMCGISLAYSDLLFLAAIKRGNEHSSNILCSAVLVLQHSKYHLMWCTLLGSAPPL